MGETARHQGGVNSQDVSTIHLHRKSLISQTDGKDCKESLPNTKNNKR